jgi:four helix bundle protein
MRADGRVVVRESCSVSGRRLRMVRTHRDLVAWQRGVALARRAYGVTSAFPEDELFGLTTQIRLAAVSVPANIFERAARGGTQELLQRLRIARDSQVKVETLGVVSSEIGILAESRVTGLQQAMPDLSVLIGSVISWLHRRAFTGR